MSQDRLHEGVLVSSNVPRLSRAALAFSRPSCDRPRPRPQVRSPLLLFMRVYAECAGRSAPVPAVLVLVPGDAIGTGATGAVTFVDGGGAVAVPFVGVAVESHGTTVASQSSCVASSAHSWPRRPWPKKSWKHTMPQPAASKCVVSAARHSGDVCSWPPSMQPTKVMVFCASNGVASAPSSAQSVCPVAPTAFEMQPARALRGWRVVGLRMHHSLGAVACGQWTDRGAGQITRSCGKHATQMAEGGTRTWRASRVRLRAQALSQLISVRTWARHGEACGRVGAV